MKAINAAVDKHRAQILAAERYLWEHPETGYRERQTTAYLSDQFRRLGYQLTAAEGITGFYTVLDTGRTGPEVLVLGELDALLCPTHPKADPETGAVHACGHHAQCAALLGVAAALTERDVQTRLCGRIRLCAVPAEELLELDYRAQLKQRGVIRYACGKREFLSRGYFESSDLALMVHTSPASAFAVNRGNVGSMVKKILYRGRSAHAGGAPQDGINALYAAECGMNAVNALRETFLERDMIRVHSIITEGGGSVSAIPDAIRLESCVRGASLAAIGETNRRVNRAWIGAALSLGAEIEITDALGYAPNENDPALIALTERALRAVLPDREWINGAEISTGSTDMGDLSCLMPTVHPYCPGARGTVHGSDYAISSPSVACADSAKWQLAMLTLLLENGGAEAKRIIDGFQPRFQSTREYLRYVDGMESHGERIRYTEGGAEVEC